MRFHFLSGLPRSGSTLMASILNQNPRFQSSVMTPLAQIVTGALGAMGPSNEAELFMGPDQKREVLRGIMRGYYHNWDAKDVIFDTNRRWTANAGLLSNLWPTSKIICLIRPVNEIVDSFERLFQKNPYACSVIYGGNPNTTVYERVAELMKPQGVVAYAYNAFKSAFFGPHAEKLICIQYDMLARHPKGVMDALYHDLGEEPFEHDFNTIEQIPGAAEYDRALHTPGLHALQPSVTYTPRRSVLPPDIWNGLPPPFWSSKEAVTSAG